MTQKNKINRSDGNNEQISAQNGRGHVEQKLAIRSS